MNVDREMEAAMKMEKKILKKAAKDARRERKAAAKEAEREARRYEKEKYEKERCSYRGRFSRCSNRAAPGKMLCEHHVNKEAERARKEAAYKQRLVEAKALKIPITTNEDVKSECLLDGRCIYQKNTWGSRLLTRPCGKPVAPGSPLCQEHTQENDAILEREQKLRLEEEQKQLELKREEEERQRIEEEQRQIKLKREEEERRRIEEEQKQLELKREEERQQEEDLQLSIAAETKRTSTSYWQSLNDKQFELEFAALMRRHGYEITQISSGADTGVDIAAIKDGEKVIVQCKATETPVSQSAVRDLYGTMISEGADKAILASTSGFSESTREFAKGKPIELVDLEQIIKLSTDVSSNNLTEAQHHLNSGASLLLDEDKQEEVAISESQKATSLKPGDAEAYYGLGIAHCKKGEYDQAIGQFEEAIRLKPDYAEAHYELGMAHCKKGEYDQAVRQYKKTIELKPDYAGTHPLVLARFIRTLSTSKPSDNAS
ncbi:MAG: restriction endonuclease [Candidatus Brocadiales bacterium]